MILSQLERRRHFSCLNVARRGAEGGARPFKAMAEDAAPSRGLLDQIRIPYCLPSPCIPFSGWLKISLRRAKNFTGGANSLPAQACLRFASWPFSFLRLVELYSAASTRVLAAEYCAAFRISFAPIPVFFPRFCFLFSFVVPARVLPCLACFLLVCFRLLIYKYLLHLLQTLPICFPACEFSPFHLFSILLLLYICTLFSVK